MAVTAYRAGALWRISKQITKPRISGTIFQRLKELNIGKPFRGSRGGTYKQRHIAVVNSLTGCRPILTRGTNVNNVIELTCAQHDLSNLGYKSDCAIPSIPEAIPIEVISNKRQNQPKDNHERVSVLKTLTEQFKWDLPTVLNTNVRSLCNKMDELDLMLRNKSVHIAGITETWCTSEHPEEAVSVGGYNTLRRDRGDRIGGGVICYIRADIPFKLWPQFECGLETLWLTAHPCKLPRQFSILLIGVVYHPPNANNREMLRHISSCIDAIMKDHPFAGIILMGDFNSLPDNSLKSSYNLKQIVTVPTRGDKVLDKVLTNMNSLYSTLEVLNPLGKADHSVVICNPLPAYKTPAPKSEPVLVRSSGKNQRAFFADGLIKADWRPLYAMSTCEQQLDYLHSTITTLLDSFMPFRTTRKCPTDRPWVTVQFKDLMKQRNKAFAAIRGTPKHRIDPRLLSQYNQLRNKVNRINRDLRSAYYKASVEELKSTNSRKWWNGVKVLTGSSSKGGNELRGLANSLCDGDDQKLADMINIFFQSVSADLPKPDKSRLPSNNDNVPDRYIITVLEVEKQLFKLDTRKAPGLDNIPTWVLHDFPGILAPTSELRTIA